MNICSCKWQLIN